ncbi:ion channel [Raineya sp.]
MKKIALFLVLAVLCASEVEAQKKPRRRLSYSELFAEIQKHPDSTYRLENAEIYYNHQTDSLRFGLLVTSNKKVVKEYNWIFGNQFLLSGYLQTDEQYLDNLLPVITIDKKLEFKNIYWQNSISLSSELRLNYPISIRRMKFKKGITFEFTEKEISMLKKSSNIKILGGTLKDVGEIFSFMPNFEKSDIFRDISVYLTSNMNDNDIRSHIWKCNIESFVLGQYPKITFNGITYPAPIIIKNFNLNLEESIIQDFGLGAIRCKVTIENCKFKNILLLDGGEELSIKKSVFSNRFFKETKKSVFNESSISGVFQKIQIDSCTFEKMTDELKKENSESLNGFYFRDVTCEKLSITNCTFNSHFSLIGSKITDEIFLENNRFNNDFSLGSGSAKSGYERNLINFETAYIPYRQFKKGLSTEISNAKTTVYHGNTDKELADSTEFEHLLLYYYKFHKMYKDQNDRASANACFIDLKRLETRYLRYRYHKTGDLDLWLEWKFYEFLDYVSEYGTNPFLALKRSWIFIIAFAVLLSVFPSVRDYLMPSVFREALQKWGLALQKEGGYTEIRSAEIQKKLDDLEAFRKSLEITEGNIPSVLAFFLKPLLVTAKLYYYLQRWFLRKMDFTQGNWHEMSRKRKLWVSTRIFFAIIFLLIWGLIMRIVNSMALSMNCFVTLGYGEIKAKGIARYLVVIEGVIGWTMLTIFSASLIAQLMG